MVVGDKSLPEVFRFKHKTGYQTRITAFVLETGQILLLIPPTYDQDFGIDQKCFHVPQQFLHLAGHDWLLFQNSFFVRGS